MEFHGYDIDTERLPRHIGIIMDGNGRWAKKRGLPRVKGHEEGFKTLKALMEFNRELGVKAITVYAFSTENWKRPETEVGYLMGMVAKIIPEYTEELLQNDIRLRVLGTSAGVDPKLWEKITASVAKTADCTSYDFIVAFNYGGKRELLDAMKSLARDAAEGKISPEDIDEKAVEARLYQPDLPEADLIIRTSGELRLSNFLLWQSAYSELYFTETLWPDFGPAEFCRAIHDFQNRKRRFGDI